MEKLLIYSLRLRYISGIYSKGKFKLILKEGMDDLHLYAELEVIMRELHVEPLMEKSEFYLLKI